MSVNKENYLIDLTNIKYCNLTIIYNNNNIFTGIERFITWTDEKIVYSSDSIILELDNEIIEINKNNQIGENMEFNNFSDYIFPSSIIKKIDNLIKYHLECIKPRLVKNISYNTQKLFNNYKNIDKIKFENSYYSSNYKNIFNDKIVFVIKKTNSNNISSRYIIAYDSEILENNDIKNIITKIFCL